MPSASAGIGRQGGGVLRLADQRRTTLSGLEHAAWVRSGGWVTLIRHVGHRPRLGVTEVHEYGPTAALKGGYSGAKCRTNSSFLIF